MKKILIIQTSFIGDVILATSLLETLYQSYKNEVELELLVRKGNEGLFEAHPYLSAIHIWDKKSKKYKHLLSLIKSLRRSNYYRVYNLQRFGATGWLTARLKADLKVGFAKNPFSFLFNRKMPHEIGNGQHEIERNFKLIAEDLPENAQLLKPKLYPTEKDVQKVNELLDEINSFMVLAPASVWFTKQAPREKWVELTKMYGPKMPVLFIGGPNDSDLIEEIIYSSGIDNAINLAGKLTLLQSAYLIHKANRTFVNDSAPLHLASAMNAPVTAFFCSTVPNFGFGPLSDDAVIVESAENLKCRPCGLHGYKACPETHFKCGTGIRIPN